MRRPTNPVLGIIKWRGWWVVLPILLLLAGAGLLSRGYLAHSVLQTYARRAEAHYGLVVDVPKPGLAGLTGLRLDSISVRLKDDQQVLFLSDLVLYPRISSLLMGSASLAEVQLDSLYLYAGDSLQQLLSTKKINQADSSASTAKPQLPDYRAALRQSLARLARIVPTDAKLRRGCIVHQHGALADTVQVTALSIVAKVLTANVLIGTTSVQLEGNVRPGSNAYQLQVQADSSRVLQLPAFTKRTGITLQLGSAALVFAADNGNLSFTLSGQGTGLQHPKLATELVLPDSFRMTFVAEIAPTTIAIDSLASTFSINTYHGNWGGSWAVGKDTSLTATLRSDTLSAQAFFDGMPLGLFHTLRGTQAKGRLCQRLYLSLNTSQLDSVRFYPSLWTEGFSIQKWGNRSPGAINDTFSIRAFRDNRKLIVGPANPNYIPLPEISRYLREAVMVSEDGGFYGHKGFYPEMIGRALGENLRQSRFARGGSTISMQLIKNVYLTPEKTIGRKLEEAMLVWLIESQRLVSKDRMLEVYLNIIEWGPGVYGIGEASQYYFGKHPSQLYYPEAIFLAMIVPRPRAFMYNFEASGQVRPHVPKYYELIMGHLIRKGIISEGERALWDPVTFRLTGPAAKVIGQEPTPQQEAIVPDDEVLEDDMEGMLDEDWKR